MTVPSEYASTPTPGSAEERSRADHTAMLEACVPGRAILCAPNRATWGIRVVLETTTPCHCRVLGQRAWRDSNPQPSDP